MLDAGLDLSRKRLDFHLLDADGATVEVGAAPPDADGLRGLSERLARHGELVRAAIESMNGARFVHDRLELAGWQVEIADAQKVKGLAPLACKTDRIDAWVLAELARRDLDEEASDRIAGQRGDRDHGQRRSGNLEVKSTHAMQVDDEEGEREAAPDRGEEVAADDDPRVAWQGGQKRGSFRRRYRGRARRRAEPQGFFTVG